MEKLGLFYVRFMDDILVLAPTRWKLRKAVKLLNKIFDELRLEMHPDNTFIGRVSRGFDFLGYRFQCDELIGVAQQTVTRFVERATRLYEQGADMDRIGEYVRRWLKWVGSGIRLERRRDKWLGEVGHIAMRIVVITASPR